jgi:transcriptional regulator with XRE-family HTH domain
VHGITKDQHVRSPDISDITKAIGERIRKARLSQNLTLKQLSKRSGLSVSMISKIENTQVFPPLSTYAKIGSCLGLSIGELIVNSAQQSDSISIVRAQERGIVSHGLYIGSPLAFRKSDKKMEPFLLSYPVGKKINHLYQHDYEEMIFVLEGCIEFHYSEQVFVLEKGDCAYYDGRSPHAARSLTAEGAQALVVQSR